MKQPLTTNVKQQCWIIVLLITGLLARSCEKLGPQNTLHVFTGEVSEIKATGCLASGVLESLPEQGLDDYGFCLSESTGPDLNDQVFSLGSIASEGAFSKSISGLKPSMKYHLRAFASADGDHVFGEEKSFTTQAGAPDKPEVSTAEIHSVTASSASCGGAVTDDGGAAVTKRGVCWGTSAAPDINGNCTADSSGLGSFESQLQNLLCDTTYYVRAYATNLAGTSYGIERKFNTLDCAVVPPSVSVSPVTDISQTSAIGWGNVIDEGGAEVTERGICWSTSNKPTKAGSHENSGSGIGSFSINIMHLKCNTRYFVRAYAVNSAGPSYSPEIEFTTSSCIVPPSVNTLTVSDVTNNSATSGGNVFSDGGAPVSSRGICWNTSGSPSITSNTFDGGSGLGQFAGYMDNLEAGTTYFVRAFASNSAGIRYGATISFVTEEENTVTDIDGNEYPTVQIGEQLWMADNLRVTRYSDGASIPLISGSSDWNDLGYDEKAYCWYDNLTSNKNTYGGLYTWAAAMNGVASSSSNPSATQGVCPSGWHLPSDEEWKQLEMYLGMSRAEADKTEKRGSDEGGELKEASADHWIGPNTGANNNTGFTALPGGYRDIDGNFARKGEVANFWSSTEQSTSYSWDRKLNTSSAAVYRTNWYKNNGFSVRCVKD